MEQRQTSSESESITQQNTWKHDVEGKTESKILLSKLSHCMLWVPKLSFWVCTKLSLFCNIWGMYTDCFSTKLHASLNVGASTHSRNRLHPKSGCGRSVENKLSKENDTILPHVLLYIFLSYQAHEVHSCKPTLHNNITLSGTLCADSCFDIVLQVDCQCTVPVHNLHQNCTYPNLSTW